MLQDDDGKALWDRPLGPEEVFRLSPAMKAQRTKTSFERKIALLERIGRGEAELGSVDPANYRTRTALRSWIDNREKLWAWVDPNVDSKNGKNAELLDRWEAAVAAINRRQTKTKSGADLQALLADKDKRIASLEAQILDLMAQLYQVQKDAVEKQTPQR
ncbi:hypothetical protein [Rhizobium leguminosarum]|uniref:hypothetical protein n=1 Tax=Rhizobium leguminosarum TaxID=384 RepID=UPI00103153E0|nr:hypothetical protein [Rhizobium leguminosarum]TAV74717.1 hypothetical protein ELI28_14815 [Rhizobium leguminosarum]TAV79316.1 hypothetical protein ELI27_14805 [Rhizobium leguminosarum]